MQASAATVKGKLADWEKPAGNVTGNDPPLIDGAHESVDGPVNVPVIANVSDCCVCAQFLRVAEILTVLPRLVVLGITVPTK
jgi:hypothetical protein